MKDVASDEDWESIKGDTNRFNRLVEICPNGIAVCRGTKIVHCNPALQRLTRQPAEHLVGQTLERILAVDVRESTLRKLREMRAAGLHHDTTCATRLLRIDGAEIDAEASIDGLKPDDESEQIIIFRPHAAFENTEQTDPQELLQLSDLHRMATFGDLTASLLHEMGQPLTAAFGASEILLTLLESQNASADTIRSARIVVDSVADITSKFQRIWQFIRQQKLSRQAVKVSELIEQMIEFTEAAVRHAGAELTFEDRDASADSAVVLADSSLLATAFGILLTRSLSSLKSAPPKAGRIAVTVSEVKNSRVEIAISHNGKMLATEENLLQHGRKSLNLLPAGQAIMIVRSIIEQHDGVFSVEETHDGNCCYRLLFPLS